ncbi:MAG: nitroreductase family protein, partial [Clostridia bacterium]|nr:nitroreductase family protein [Clostridia bacterium]
MSEVLTKMQTRRSIRKFKPDMLPKDVIEQIVTAGTYAANGRNLQSPIILAITNREVRDKLSKLNADIMGAANDPFYGAPVVL